MDRLYLIRLLVSLAAIGICAISFAQSERILETVTLSGQEPGGTLGTVERIYTPSINDAGTVAFIAKTATEVITFANVDINELFKKSRGQAVESVLVYPGSKTAGQFLTINSAIIDRTVPFPINAQEEIGATAIFENQSRHLVARGVADFDVLVADGDPVPGTDPQQLVWMNPPIQVRINDFGETAVVAVFRPDGGFTTVGSAIYKNGTILVRNGSNIPEIGGPYRGVGEPVINDLGQILFEGARVLGNEVNTQNDEFLVTETDGAFDLRLAEGDLAPGFPITETKETRITAAIGRVAFRGYQYNNQGQIAMSVGLGDVDPNPGSGPTTVFSQYLLGEGYEGIYLAKDNDPESDQIIVAQEQPAEIFDAPNSFLNGLSSPNLSDSGLLIFTASFGPNHVNVAGKGLFLYDTADSSIQRIYKTGDDAGNGLSFGPTPISFETLTTNEVRLVDDQDIIGVNDNGELAFLANLGGWGDNTKYGLFFYNESNGLTQIAVEGESFEVPGGNDTRTVDTILFHGGSSSSGRPAGINENGDIAFALKFGDPTNDADDSYGLFLYAAPARTKQFEWTGNFGDNNWHSDFSNWKDSTTNGTANALPGNSQSDTVLIQDANIVLDSQEATLDSINATGSLKVFQPISLKSNSSIENLDLNADLTTSNKLQLTGLEHIWRNGTISGGGSVEIVGDLDTEEDEKIIIQAGDGMVRLESMLSIVQYAQLILRNGTLDLNSAGKLENRNGVSNTIILESGTITDSGDQPSIINLNTLEKRTSGTVTLDAFLESKAEGNIKVLEGTLLIDDPSNIDSEILVWSSSILEFGQALHTIGGALEGVLIENLGTINANGPISIAGNADSGRVSIENSGTINFASGIEELLEASFQISNQSGGIVNLLNPENESAEFQATNKGTINFAGTGPIAANIVNDEKVNVSTSASFSAGESIEFENNAEIVFSSGNSTFDTKFINNFSLVPGQQGGPALVKEGLVRVIAGASVDINNNVPSGNLPLPDEGIPSPQGPLWGGNWSIENGTANVKEESDSAFPPIDIIGVGTQVRLLGSNSKLNNLPNPENLFGVFGSLELGDITFSVTGESSEFLIGTFGALRLQDNSVLAANRVESSFQSVLALEGSATIKAEEIVLEGFTVIDGIGIEGFSSNREFSVLSDQSRLTPQAEVGTATIEGNLTLGEMSITTFVVGERDSSISFSQLNVTGLATLAGALVISNPENIVFTDNIAVNVIAAGSITGAFDSIEISDPSGRQQYETTASETGLTVSSSTLAVSTFEEWRQAIFTTEELADDQISGADVDNDKDSLSVFEEYLHDGHPNRNDLPPLDVEFDHDTEGDSTTITISFPWADDMADYGYQVQVSTNLIDWEPLETSLVSAEDRGPNSLVTLSAEETIGADDEVFIRLQTVGL